MSNRDPPKPGYSISGFNIFNKEVFMNNRIEIGQRGKNLGVLCFYEPINDATSFQMEAACAEIPEQALLSEKKMFSLYYEFEEYQPIRKSEEILQNIVKDLEKLGWMYYENKEYPDTQSGLRDLTDTSDYKFANTKYANYSHEDNVGGFNICKGLLVVMYKDEPSPVNENEKNEIDQVFEKHFESLD